MKVGGSVRARTLGLVVGVIAMFGIFAGGASAVIIKLGNGQTFSYQSLRGAASSFDAALSNLDYNGGPVMPSNRNYLVFWSPSGLSAYPTEYPTGIAKYMTDLAHDSGGGQNVDSVSTQYGDSTGNFAKYTSTFGGTKTDTDAYPASQCPVVAPATHCLVDSQLQAELSKFINANSLPRDLKHQYFLLLPPHVENCFDANVNDPNGPFGGCSAGEAADPMYCAYHGNSTSSPMFIYSNDPYVVGNPGCDDGNHPNGPSDGALQGGLSHEHNESITDPLPNSAWTDIGGSGGEIGDKCGGVNGTSLGTHNGAKFNQLINGDFYWYQEEWSNQTHKCLQRFTLNGTLPTTKFTANVVSGSTMTFNASGSSATTGIAHFNWQFNDSPGLNFPVERSTPTVQHTFPSVNPFIIGLTVLTSDGTSRGGGGLITPGHNGFSAGFSVSPASPTAGSPVTFTAITAIAGRTVTAYSWDFGDGSTGSGRTPSHTYATAKSYRVRLTMLSTGGSAITTKLIAVG